MFFYRHMESPGAAVSRPPSYICAHFIRNDALELVRLRRASNHCLCKTNYAIAFTA